MPLDRREGKAAPGVAAGEHAAREQWQRVDAHVSGRACSHVETNYGAAFPTGWIYIQFEHFVIKNQ